MYCVTMLSLSLSLSSFGWESYMALYLFFCYQNVSHATGEFKTSDYYLFFFFFFKFYKGRTNGPNIKLKKKKSFLPILYLYYWFFFFFYLFCKIPFWNIYFRINEQNVGYIFCLLFYFKEVFFLKKIILKKLMRTINK